MTAPTPSPDQYKTEFNTKCLDTFPKHPYETSIRSSIVAHGSKLVPEALTHYSTLGAPLPGAPLHFPPNLPRDSQHTSTLLSAGVPLFHLPQLSIHQCSPGPVGNMFYMLPNFA